MAREWLSYHDSRTRLQIYAIGLLISRMNTRQCRYDTAASPQKHHADNNDDTPRYHDGHAAVYGSSAKIISE